LTEEVGKLGLESSIRWEHAPQTPFLDYYDTLGYVPTRQMGTMRDLFRRREELYLRLGLPPALFRGARVLEFGPGSGENASFTASLEPAEFRVVDGNSWSLEQTRNRVRECAPSVSLETIHAGIEEYQDDSQYDIVLCEGLLPFQTDPIGLLAAVSKFVGPGGCLVITCADPISMLPESLRRYTAQLLISRGETTSQVVDFMGKFFAEDLSYLPGMTRRSEDWIVDQLLHPWTGATLSIGDALEALLTDFRPTGSSPSLFTDWRWYKDYEVTNADWVHTCITQFRTARLNLMDRRVLLPPMDSEVVDSVLALAESCYSLVCVGRAAYSPTEFADLSNNLEKGLARNASISAMTRASAEGFCNFISSGNPADLHSFRSWWGRGQQYLAVTRNL